MSTLQEKTPIQYSNSKIVLMLKKLLHTKLGAKIGFGLGLKGFNRVGVVHTCAKTGKQKFLGFAYNSRVNIGSDLIGSLITGAAQNSIVTPLPPLYIALSTATLTPAAADTTLASETTKTGVARAIGAVQSYTRATALDGSASFNVYKLFTLTDTATTIVSAALFDNTHATPGNMFVEANLASSAVMATNDTLGVTWVVNY